MDSETTQFQFVNIEWDMQTTKTQKSAMIEHFEDGFFQ